ncbi:MAG: hypothetical protein WBA54_10395 [Acidaminobacteraceae bacterium]
MGKKILATLIVVVLTIALSYYFIVVKNNNDELVVYNDGFVIETADTYKEVRIGEIDIAVEFINPTNNIEDFWSFEISLDTHSVDLEAIDFEKSISFISGNDVIIKNGFELKEYGSGHHISRVLELPKKINGKDTILKESDSFKMIFSNIENVEKTEIEWNMDKYSSIFN